MSNSFVSQALHDVREAPPNLRLVESSKGKIVSADVKWKVKKDPRSRSTLTDDHLRVKLSPSETNTPDTSNLEAIHPEVYALGDCGIIEGTTYPATAQVASQKAVWLAKHLNQGDTGKTGFTYKNLGTLTYIGNWNASLQGGGGGRLSGYLVWIVWRGCICDSDGELEE